MKMLRSGNMYDILNLLQRCEALFYRLRRVISILAVVTACHFDRMIGKSKASKKLMEMNY